MRIVKDKETGKYKHSPLSKELFDTKQQAQWAWLNQLAEKLEHIKRKYNDGVLGYGK